MKVVPFSTITPPRAFTSFPRIGPGLALARNRIIRSNPNSCSESVRLESPLARVLLSSTARAFTSSTKLENSFDGQSGNEASVFAQQPLQYWKDPRALKAFADFLAKKLNISQPGDWYKVTTSDIRGAGGSKLLSLYESVEEFLKVTFPEETWLTWKFPRVPPGFWKNIENQKQYMKWLSELLKREEGVPEHWYSVSLADFHSNFGGSLLSLFNNSPYQLLSQVYPNSKWLPWKFSITPTQFWKERANQRLYCDWLGEHLGYSSREDWYKLQSTDLNLNYGTSLLFNYYNGSPSDLVQTIYDDFDFIPWKFTSVPKGFWDKQENQRAYVDWLKKTVGVPDERQLNVRHFLENRGSGLLAKYDQSPHLLLFFLGRHGGSNGKGSNGKGGVDYTPRNYWTSIENQRAFLEDLANSLGFDIHDLQRWYALELKDYQGRGGSGLLNLYRNSPSAMLKAVFPELEWLPWKFSTMPRRIWEDKEAMHSALKLIKTTFSIKSDEEWRRLSPAQLQQLGLAQVVAKAGGLPALLEKYPDAVQ